MDSNPIHTPAKNMSFVQSLVQYVDLRVDRTEMALDPPNLFFKHFMPEPRLKLSLA